MAIFELIIAMFVGPPDAQHRESPMMRTLVLGAATFALSAGAASAQALYPSDGYGPYGYGYIAPAPLYDYAGKTSATPNGYGPPIFTPRLYIPTPAFPAPPAEPGYYTAQSVVVSQPLYDYAPSNWER